MDRDERIHSARKPDQRPSEFEVDRDRVLYSTALRRLEEVTQVTGPDHGYTFHNRLTHSIKVAQVARRLAEHIKRIDPDLSSSPDPNIDSDVVETAALCHDLGHPPFGHAAEVTLNKLAEDNELPDGFEGNPQTFRIVSRLAKHRLEYNGLNLTAASLNAVLKYPWPRAEDGKRYKKYGTFESDRTTFDKVRESFGDSDDRSLEAQIMDYADGVTYSIHDLEDFYLAGLVPLDLLSQSVGELSTVITAWASARPDSPEAQWANTSEGVEGLTNMLRLLAPNCPMGSREHTCQLQSACSKLISDSITKVTIGLEDGPNSLVQLKDEPLLRIQAFLRWLIWHYVIESPRLSITQAGQCRIVEGLFDIYFTAVKQERFAIVPIRLRHLCEDIEEEEPCRIAVDVVASLTDREALTLHHRLTGIAPGSVFDLI